VNQPLLAAVWRRNPSAYHALLAAGSRRAIRAAPARCRPAHPATFFFFSVAAVHRCCWCRRKNFEAVLRLSADLAGFTCVWLICSGVRPSRSRCSRRHEHDPPFASAGSGAAWRHWSCWLLLLVAAAPAAPGPALDQPMPHAHRLPTPASVGGLRVGELPLGLSVGSRCSARPCAGGAP